MHKDPEKTPKKKKAKKQIEVENQKHAGLHAEKVTKSWTRRVLFTS